MRKWLEIGIAVGVILMAMSLTTRAADEDNGYQQDQTLKYIGRSIFVRTVCTESGIWKLLKAVQGAPFGDPDREAATTELINSGECSRGFFNVSAVEVISWNNETPDGVLDIWKVQKVGTNQIVYSLFVSEFPQYGG